MKASVYYSVQLAQSEYMLLWEKGMYTDIVARTFADLDDISVSYEGYGSACGKDEVIRFFEKLSADAAKNGSILRNDLPESQVIAESQNEKAAVGTWITMTGIIHGPAFGVPNPPYPYKYYIGKYENEYVPMKDGRWGIKSICWKPVLAVGNWTMDPAKGIGLFYTQPEKWPAPFCRRAVEEETDALTQTKVDIRLAVMTFAQQFFRDGVSAISTELFSAEAGRHAREMLDGTQEGFKGAPMLTSPIISVTEDLKEARIFLNTLYIKPYGTQVTSNKGRISARLIKGENGWRFETFDWQCYCTLVPWDVTGYWPENV